MDILLQPLRIPSGWNVSHNNCLYETDPVAKAIPDDKHLWCFKEDMLMLEHAHYNRLLHVGWYPSEQRQEVAEPDRCTEPPCAFGTDALEFWNCDKSPLGGR